MIYEKPRMKVIVADVAVQNMAGDQGSCHGGHCVKCIRAYG